MAPTTLKIVEWYSVQHAQQEGQEVLAAQAAQGAVADGQGRGKFRPVIGDGGSEGGFDAS